MRHSSPEALLERLLDQMPIALLVIVEVCSLLAAFILMFLA